MCTSHCTGNGIVSVPDPNQLQRGSLPVSRDPRCGRFGSGAKTRNGTVTMAHFAYTCVAFSPPHLERPPSKTALQPSRDPSGGSQPPVPRAADVCVCVREREVCGRQQESHQLHWRSHGHVYHSPPVLSTSAG